MWWTTGVGYDTKKITDSPTSSKALWDPRYAKHISMLDDYQEVFALALIQLGYSANTTDTAELDEALALLEQQKPLVRTYTTDTVTTMSSGDCWIGHIWGADLTRSRRRTRTSSTTSPRRAASRARTRWRSSRAPSIPIAAHLFINHMLDAQVSADNTNFIGYMGPNAAAKEFIDPTYPRRPGGQPGPGDRREARRSCSTLARRSGTST